MERFALWGLEHDDLLFASLEVVQVRQGRLLFWIPKMWDPFLYPAGRSLGFASELVVEKEAPLTWSEKLVVTDALVELLWDTVSGNLKK